LEEEISASRLEEYLVNPFLFFDTLEKINNKIMIENEKLEYLVKHFFYILQVIVNEDVGKTNLRYPLLDGIEQLTVYDKNNGTIQFSNDYKNLILTFIRKVNDRQINKPADYIQIINNLSGTNLEKIEIKKVNFDTPSV